MKKLLALFAGGIALSLTSGCLSLSVAQLEGKLPQFSAAEAHVHVNTIYGAKGQLDVVNLRYENGVKKADQYDVTLDSPWTSITVTTRGVSLPGDKANAKPEVKPLPIDPAK